MLHPAEAVRAAFHRPGTRIYRVTQTLVGVLIGLSVALLGVEAFAPAWLTGDWLPVLDLAVLWVFLVEVVLRVGSFRPKALDFFELSWTSRLRAHVLGRLRFCLQPLILFDIIAVAALVPELRGLRVLRLLRLVRAHRIFRYSYPFEGTLRAFRDNKLLFLLAFSLFGASVLLGGLSFYLVESQAPGSAITPGDGIWWAIVTLTTVGFGDITPSTPQGKMVGGVLMVAGMFNLALFAGIVGNTLLNAVLSVREEQFRMSGILDHLVICGYDPGARMLLDACVAEIDLDSTPVVLFAEGERPGDLPPAFMWVDGDPTKESELDKVRLDHAGAIIVVGSRDTSPQIADATTILTVFTIRSYLSKKDGGRGRGGEDRGEIGRGERREPLYVVAEILDSENVEHARTAGADEVIETTQLGFSLLAHSVSVPGSGAIMSRVASSGAHSLFVGHVPEEIPTPIPFGRLAHQLKEEQKVLLLGVRDPRTGRDRMNPPDEMPVREDALLIYLAEEERLPAV